MIPRTLSMIPILALALSACGGGSSGNTTSGATTASEGGGGGTMPADFKATDACAVIDKATMGALLKTEVSETQLALVHEPNGNEAGTSECTYLTKDGRASLMTRWSPISDNSAEAMKTARDTSAASVKAFGKTIEDVAGLGKTAFWVPGINQLSVFIGDAKFIIVTVPDVAGSDPKAAATAVAKKLGA